MHSRASGASHRDLLDDDVNNIIEAVVCHIYSQVVDVMVDEHIRYLLVQTAQMFGCELVLAFIDFLVVAGQPKGQINRPIVEMEEIVVDSVSWQFGRRVELLQRMTIVNDDPAEARKAESRPAAQHAFAVGRQLYYR